MAISNRHSSMVRPHLIITENRFLIHCMEKGTENSSKRWITIQRTDRKLWPFRPVHQVWLDQTSTSPRIDSSSPPWKRASGNSNKSMIAIQRSDQKLWLFRTVTQALDDHTSSSPRISSSSTAWKRAPKTPVKDGSRSNGRIASYGPFDPSIKPGSTRPQHHRESIPHALHGKGHPKTPVNVLSRSNSRIKSYGPFDPSIQPGSTRAHHHRVSIPHPLHGTGHPETPVKV